MRRGKRAAISLKPKQPYVDWANGLEQCGVKIGTEYTPEENIYLIADDPDETGGLEALLEPCYAQIFEEELGAWHRVEADWPRRRNWRPFWHGLRWKCTAWRLTWLGAGYAASVMSVMSDSGQAARR